ncbi:MAG: hypothetical protein H6974_11465 [Gammaproteobacteria bacterium]|nr:hypothetical protein [Gammaproteobacteria bacterium]
MKDFYLQDMTFNYQDNDQIFKINEDNRTPQHLLAKKMADEIWNIFEKHRTDIEALPSFGAAST